MPKMQVATFVKQFIHTTNTCTMHLTRSTMLAAMAGLFIFIGCKKDTLKNPEQVPAQRLVLQFGPNTIGVQLVDSTSLLVYPEGTNERRALSFKKYGDSLVADLAQLTSGGWKAELKIWSAKGAFAYPREYYREITINNPTGATRVNAPNGALGQEWKPRSILQDIANGITAILPIDPVDAYFSVTVANSRWKDFYIRRIARNANGIPVAMKEYNKRLPGELITLSNFIAFATFAQEMQQKEWSETEAGLVFTDAQQAEATMLHRYSK
jgi:hypothetical protein